MWCEATLGAVVRGSRKTAGRASQESKPVSNTLLWPLHQFLPSLRSCPDFHQWMKGMLNNEAFYSAIRKNEIIKFIEKWMEPENTVLSEVTLAQKSK